MGDPNLSLYSELKGKMATREKIPTCPLMENDTCSKYKERTGRDEVFPCTGSWFHGCTVYLRYGDEE